MTNGTTIVLSDNSTRTATGVTLTLGPAWVLSDNLATTSDLPAGSHSIVDANIVGSSGTAVKTKVLVSPGAPVIVPSVGASGNQLPDAGDVGLTVYSQKTFLNSAIRLIDLGDTGISNLIMDTHTTTPSLSTTTDKTKIFHRRGGTTKWITGLNTGFLNVDSYDFTTIDLVPRVTITQTGDIKNTGYMRLGSTTTPANTTAGDLTISRLNVGNNLAFSDTNGNVLNISGTAMASTASGAAFNNNFGATLTPPTNSLSDFRVNNFRTTWNPATGVTSSTIENLYIDNRIYGDGLLTTSVGVYSQPITIDASSSSTVQLTNTFGFQTILAARPSGTTIATLGTGIGYDFSTVGSIGLIATTITGFRMQNPGSGNTITTLIGMDIAALTRGITNNIGLRIGLPSGATNNYALQLSDTGATAAGGITFGTDTQVYRSAANVLTFNSVTLAGLVDPTTAQQAATKNYVDTHSGTGITRTITSISSPTTAGATTHTDYVYFVSGTTTLTLPTAVGNTNRYSVKNTGSNTVTIAFTSGQTGDGSSTLTLAPNITLELVSDNANYRIL